MNSQRMYGQIARFLAVVGSFLACSSEASFAAARPSNNSPARPLTVTSATKDFTGLTLLPGAYEELKQSSAEQLIAIPDGQGGEFELELRRFTATVPESRFVSAGPQGQITMPAPDLIAYRGQIAGEPGSHAFLSMSSDGLINGYITKSNGVRYFLSTPDSNVAAGRMAILAPESATPGILEDVAMCGVTSAHDLRVTTPSAAARAGDGGRSPRVLYVAVDTDQKFYNLFNDANAAQAYIIQVIAAVSDIYIRDFDAKLVLTFSRLWPNGGEPFSPTSLDGFRNYWLTNEDSSPYHLISMMSGTRATAYGGIAYVSGSCSGSAYSISAFLLGSFPTPIGAPNLGTWDVVVVAHEMGHNMGTFHTHDGYSPPIDQCGSSGAWARGEIMSYCHTLAGGLLNTDLRFTSRVQEVVRGDLETNNCQFFDCNDNGIDDALDITGAQSADTNGNQIPDECEDCNANGVLDPAEIAQGAPDINANSVPDFCEPDCNGNGTPDAYEIFNLGVADANLNLVPDACEADCDGNSVADFVQIASSSGTLDVDRNGELDSCQDCNANGVSDWIDLLRPGNIYIADLSDFVRDFHAASGAGTGTLGQGSLLDPYDVTFGPDRLLYVADFGNNRVRRINPDTGASSVFGATGSSTLAGPSGLTFGPNGNLFVSSHSDARVVEFDGQTGALVRNFVGAGSGGLSTPYGLAFLPNGNLLVAGGNRVNEYDGTSGAFVRNFVAPGAGGLSTSRGMALLSDGRVLVVNRSSNQVLAYDANGASLGKFNDEYPLGGLWGIRVGPNGNVFVVRVSGGVRIIEYDVNTGRYVRSFIRGDALLSQPTGLAFRPDSPLDCNFNSVLDACDITGGLEEDANGNGIPDACDVACTPLSPPAVAPDVSKNRYLSFDVAGASQTRAIMVTLVDLPPPFEAYEGQTRWVGPPQDRPDTLTTTFKAAVLQCDPFYSDWSGVGVLSIYDSAIMPGGRYEIRSITDSCPLQDQAEAIPLEAVTVAHWGDLVEPFNPPSTSVQPDFGDISAMVDKFKNAPSAQAMALTDMYPNTPDQVLDFSDISLVVDAFKGRPYPFPGPTACP